MPLRTLIGVIVFVCGLSCAIIATFLVFQIVDSVNEELPEEQKFTRLGWSWPKYNKLAGEYRTRHPKGRLLHKFRAVVVLMFACGLISAWFFGILAR